MNQALKKYNEIEKLFFKKAKKIFKDDLLLYCVTGSLSRHEIIDNWSDIDVILVIKTNYDIEYWKKIKKLLKNSGPVHVGCTFYSPEEFNGNLFKDPKTLHSIFLIKNKIYKPRIIKKEINLKKIYLSQIKIFDIVDFSKFIHELKRELVNFPNFDEKKVLKLIYTLIKIILRQKGECVYGYFDSAEKFKEIFLMPHLIILPLDIINNSITKEERFNVYISFLGWIKNYKYAQFIY